MLKRCYNGLFVFSIIYEYFVRISAIPFPENDAINAYIFHWQNTAPQNRQMHCPQKSIYVNKELMKPLASFY